MSAAIEKRERKMGLVARRICELLEKQPGISARQVSEALGISYSAATWQMGSLTDKGYVQIGGKHFATYQLTGKKFPSSQGFQLSTVQLKRREKPATVQATPAAEESPLDEVDRAVRAMVLHARAAEGERVCA